MALSRHSNTKPSFKIALLKVFFSGGGISNAIPNLVKHLEVKRLTHISSVLNAEVQELGQSSRLSFVLPPHKVIPGADND